MNFEVIVKASREQGIGLKETNPAVNVMGQSNRQNAAMVKQSTAASHGLSQEAEYLFGLIRQFEVGERGPVQAMISERSKVHVASFAGVSVPKRRRSLASGVGSGVGALGRLLNEELLARAAPVRLDGSRRFEVTSV